MPAVRRRPARPPEVVVTTAPAGSAAEGDDVPPPDKAETAPTLPTKKDCETVFFDTSEMREALRRRWRHASYRQRVLAALTGMERDVLKAPAPVSADGEAFLAGREATPSASINALESAVLGCLREMRSELPRDPWHDLIAIVSPDLPLTAEEVVAWIDTLCAGTEADDVARGRIFAALSPPMQQHPQTAVFMSQMALPFRSYFVAAVVCHVLQELSSCASLEASRRASSAGGLNGSGAPITEESMRKLNAAVAAADQSALSSSMQSHRGGGNGLGGCSELELSGKESVATLNLHRRPFDHQHVFPAHIHAAMHAKDVEEVLFIDSLVPGRGADLEKYVRWHAKKAAEAESAEAAGDGGPLSDPNTSKKPGTKKDVVSSGTKDDPPQNKKKQQQSRPSSNLRAGIVCTRYAQYHLNYLRSTDQWDDVRFIAAMMPLAQKGLAHAQYDVGMCFASLKDRSEALAWLARAAAFGHTKAMLQLAELHLAAAFDVGRPSSSSDDKERRSLANLVVGRITDQSDDATTVAAGAGAVLASTVKGQVTKGNSSNGSVSAQWSRRLRSGARLAQQALDTTADAKRRRAETEEHIRLSLSWLDKLMRGPDWDVESPQDRDAAQRVFSTIQDDAMLALKERATLDQQQQTRLLRILGGAVLCLFALFLLLTFMYLSGTLAPLPNARLARDISSAFVSPYALGVGYAGLEANAAAPADEPTHAIHHDDSFSYRP